MVFYWCLVKFILNLIFFSVFEQIGSVLECSDNLVCCQLECVEEIFQEYDVIFCVICQYDSEWVSQVMCQYIFNEGVCLNIDLCLLQV